MVRGVKHVLTEFRCSTKQYRYSEGSVEVLGKRKREERRVQTHLFIFVKVDAQKKTAKMWCDTANCCATQHESYAAQKTCVAAYGSKNVMQRSKLLCDTARMLCGTEKMPRGMAKMLCNTAGGFQDNTANAMEHSKTAMSHRRRSSAADLGADGDPRPADEGRLAWCRWVRFYLATGLWLQTVLKRNSLLGLQISRDHLSCDSCVLYLVNMRSAYLNKVNSQSISVA